jgi:hypothetical protein
MLINDFSFLLDVQGNLLETIPSVQMANDFAEHRVFIVLGMYT